MKIAVAQGDGVGKEIIPPCIDILNLLLTGPKFIDLDIGYSKWAREGAPITDSDIELIKQTDCMLLGAVTSVPGSSVVVRLRRTFDLFANLRPFRSYDLTRYPLNMTIIRENLEGLYAGKEEVSVDTAVTKRVITRYNTERLASFASTLQNVKKITIVHKANVLKSDILLRDVCARVLEEHHISYDEMYVDAAAYNLIKHPEMFDHILTSNMFGDVLSDEAAGLVGSIANPIGSILSAKMLLEWAGERSKAILLDNAVKKTIENGVKTPDLGGTNSTKEVTRSIISCL